MVLALLNSVGVSRTFASEQETLIIMRRFGYSLVAFIGQYIHIISTTLW